MELILIINAGSSSHKCALFGGESNQPIWRGHLEWKEGFRDAVLTVDWMTKSVSISSAQEGLEKLLLTLPTQKIDAIGHRVVHGGDTFVQTTLITDKVKTRIRELAYLAPLHNPTNLIGIETTQRVFPSAAQYAIFDTAFHTSMPEAHKSYPLPKEWREKGVHRYGFHGVSHAYCSQKAAQFLDKELGSLKIVVCHLGAGASLCAIDGGKSIDTTMGMTPLEGLMMASRSGSIDPGAILHLLEHEKIDPDTLNHALNYESGLLGVSELSEDLRDIYEAASAGHPQAKLAIEMFVHSIRRHLGGMIATLGGLDVLVFTAGIGENAPYIREEVCVNFSYLGVMIDQIANTKPSRNERVISSESSNVHVLVIPTQEEWEMAHEVVTCHSGRALPFEGSL